MGKQKQPECCYQLRVSDKRLGQAQATTQLIYIQSKNVLFILILWDSINIINETMLLMLAKFPSQPKETY